MKALASLLLLIGLCLISLLVVLGWARRANPTDSAWILYSADYDGQYRIYRTLPNGARTEALTPPNLWAVAPTWKPDGSAFAYGTYVLGTGERIINSLDLQTRVVETLVAADTIGIARWSPDGKALAYISGDNQRLYKLTLATQTTEVVVEQNASIASVDWSPDGQWLVFVGDYQAWREVYRVRQDGTQRERLTSLRTGIGSATWSPNGASILFSTTARNNWDIYRLGVDTWQATPLTSLWIHEIQPSWSPAGDWIIFTSNRNGDYHLHRMRPDGSQSQAITQGNGDEQGPVWGPTVDLAWHAELLAGLAIGSTILGSWMRRPR